MLLLKSIWKKFIQEYTDDKKHQNLHNMQRVNAVLACFTESNFN